PGAVAAEPRRRRLESHAGADCQARRRQRPPAGLPLLAQSPVPGTQPEADLTLDGCILFIPCAPRTHARLAHPCVVPARPPAPFLAWLSRAQSFFRRGGIPR